jgi:hypothetical protein
MRVGIICEGSSDFVLLEALALDLLPADECVQLHPDFDKLRATGDSSHAPGWQGVRRFLQTSGPALALAVYDVIVIQVDASIRKLREFKLPQPEEREGEPHSLEALCDHVKSWATDGLPESAVIALPREDIEAWLVAAHTRVKAVESLGNPASELAAHGIIGTVNGKPNKNSEVYRALAVSLVKLARDSKKVRAVPELERFANKLRARARKVRGSKR